MTRGKKLGVTASVADTDGRGLLGGGAVVREWDEVWGPKERKKLTRWRHSRGWVSGRVKRLGVMGVGERTENIRIWGSDKSSDVLWRKKEN